ncbi:MAG TPA: putative O-glycosylation ligase, exosortase A system-associated [Rhizomicrobium sp.]|nr:putative O-glycosylation ligase, exosortase A system-associated [Rhizomicrobium sp.]
MRDLILLLALLSIVPLILRAPHVGILTWIWITILSPQREVYGFLSGFELNFYIAMLTVVGWILSREKKIVPLNPVTGFLILFGLWTCITTYTALDPSYSANILDRTLKSIFLALSIVTLATNKGRIQAVIWILAISLGYYAVKGGGFVLLTGGKHHVYGPASTMIEDNNALGLALVMLMPLLNYLRTTSQSRLASLAAMMTMGLTLVAVVGTYSRGALLALAASGVAYTLKSRSGFIPLLLGGMLAISLPSLVPSGWFDRMSTIQAYNQDTSFEGRVAAWRTAIEIVKQRPFTGGGFSSTDLDWVALSFHSPGSLMAGKAAHSIYFEVLGDHGFIGLALYLVLIAAAWFNTSIVLGATRGDPTMSWANSLARMMQVSIVGYLVGGAALSMAYYDGFMVLLATTAALAIAVRQPIGQQSAKKQPHWMEIAAQGLPIPIGASLPGWQGAVAGGKPNGSA